MHTSPLNTHIFLLHFQPKTIFSLSHLTLLNTLHVRLWLLQTSCSIFMEIVCYNHSRVFHACFTISMYFTWYRYSGCHAKIGNFNAKNSMCPILPLYKNYLEPKNYLEVSEWQDDTWSGNCLLVFMCTRRQETTTGVYCLQRL